MKRAIVTLYGNRFLLARRAVQVGVMLLLVGANAWGWRVLTGNLSCSRVADAVPLADPHAVLQLLGAGAEAGLVVGADALLGAAITLVFYGLFFGRAFCAWICPLNPVTDLANRLRRRFDAKSARSYQRAR